MTMLTDIFLVFVAPLIILGLIGIGGLVILFMSNMAEGIVPWDKKYKVAVERKEIVLDEN